MTGACNERLALAKPSGGPSAPGRRLEGEQCGEANSATLRFPRQSFLDVAKAKEAVGAWATELAS